MGKPLAGPSVLQTFEVFSGREDFLAANVGHGGPGLRLVAAAGRAMPRGQTRFETLATADYQARVSWAYSPAVTTARIETVFACHKDGLQLREWILLILVTAALTAALPVFLYRVSHDTGGTDFPEFHAAGRYVLDHAARQPLSILHCYLPSVDVAWALFGWLPQMPAAVLYYVLSVATWLGLLHTVGRYLLPMTPAADRRIVLLAAAALTLVCAVDHFLLGAFHALMLWLLVAGVARCLSGRTRSGAVLLGLAVWLKLLPLLGVGYLLLKRKWRGAVLALLVAASLDGVLSVAAYGPQAAWQEHVRWWRADAVGNVRDILTAERFTGHQRDRNQSLAAVLRRMLRRPPPQPVELAGPRVSLANLSGIQLQVVYFTVTGLLIAALTWWWRTPAKLLRPPQFAAEMGVLALTPLWFSPIVLSYHPVAAAPALALVLGTRWERSRLKTIALLAWVLATAMLAWPTGRAVGAYLWASLLLGWAAASCTRVTDPTNPDPETGGSNWGAPSKRGANVEAGGDQRFASAAISPK
jgi:hypothetical protein